MGVLIMGQLLSEGLSSRAGVAVARVLKKIGIPNPGLKGQMTYRIDGQKNLPGILFGKMVSDQDVCQLIIGNRA